LIKLKPQIDEEIGNGNMFPLFNWLRENIHYYGSIYSAAELCKKITGETLNSVYYITYLQEKFKKIYEL
jgi:carboxypeptidase Taq